MAPPRFVPSLRPTLTKKIGLLLLLPLMGSLAGALVFASYLRSTRTYDHVVNVAGRQRMLSAELRDWAHMVTLGQEEDRAGLRSRVEEFEQALVALQRGGRVLDGVVAAAPPELQPQLAAVTYLWNELRPDLLTVAEAPRGEARFVEAYGRVQQRLPELRDLADRFVTAVVARHQRRREGMLGTLRLVAAVNLAVLLGGLFLTRHNIVRPILRLERAAKRIEAGDFSLRLDASTHDELGTLARTFNGMVGQVARLIAALDLRRKHAEVIAASVPTWLLVLREDLTVLGVNRSFVEAFGLDEGAVAGKELTDLLPVHGLREAALEVLSSGEPRRALHLEMPWGTGKRSLSVTIARTHLEEEEEEAAALLVSVENLTEEERLAARARASQRRFQEVVENATDGFVLMGKDGLISHFNRAAEKMFDWRREEVLGKPVTMLMPESYRAAHEHGVERYLATGALNHHGSVRQYEGLRKDGTVFPLEYTVSAYRSDGDVVFTGVLRDVTERRRAEEHTRLLAAALESVADPVCITDTAGAIQYVNDAFSRQNGYAIAEVLGMNPRILKSGGTDPAVHAALWQALTAGRVFSGTLVNRRKDGSTYEAVLTAAPVRDASGTVAHYVSTHRDITERRRADEAVRRSEAELHALVDRAAFGIYRSTFDGRLLMVNRALVEMLGYDSAEELLALDMASALYAQPEERSRLLGLYEAGDHFKGVEADWQGKDGTPIRVRLSGRSVHAPDAEPATFEVFVEDITERRTLEEQLRQSQKMQAVGELAGGMAHDFNNVLATILVNSEFVSAELPAGSSLAEDLDAIRQSALKGAELTRKLLAFGRRQHLEMGPVDMGPLVADFGRMMRRVIREDIQMRVIIEEAKLVALADPGAVEQVLMNLVTNARDAMPSGGTLLVQARRTVLDEAYYEKRGWEGKPGEFVAMEVRDTGVGMDEATKQRIFEPFFTTKPVGEGTGLGMAMVYGLVKQHGGYLEVESELERGTTVRVFLPAVAEAPEGPVAAAPPELRGGTETILLAEDEEALRHATKRVLERHGYTVLTAANGVEALDAFQSHRAEIALVISDVVMPEMGGAELFQRLQLAGHRVRFLFTSGYTPPDVEATAKIPSGILFLMKPLTVADLLWRVRTILDAPCS